MKYIDNGVGSMQSHINLVRDLADRLDAIGAGVSDEDMAMTLLCSLPESYDYLIVALESRSIKELTSDFVASRLLSEEKRKEENAIMNSSNINANIVTNVYAHGKVGGIGGNSISNNSNNSDSIALYSNTKSFGNMNKVNKSMIKCSYCKKKNHTESTCYVKHGYPNGHPKHPSNANSINNNNTNASIASVSVNNAALHAFMVNTNTIKNSGNHTNSQRLCDWLIDSGASMHLCNNRNYFDNATFKQIHHKNVILGNNECISAIGIGDIPVRVSISSNVNNNSNNNTNNHSNTNSNINNTSNIIDVVFKDVLYVPDIAANLLSVAKMTTNGVNVMFNGDECNIINRFGECIGNAYKQPNSNLYRIGVEPICAMYANDNVYNNPQH